MSHAANRLALIEDIEFLLSCSVGEGAILASTGYTANPETLKRRLYRAGRPDLVSRVFEWEAEVNALMHPGRAA